MTVAVLRDLTEADLPWMAQAEREIFGQSAWSPSLIRQDWRAGGNRYRGVQWGAELAGYAVYGFEGDTFHLMNLAVLADFRRRGLARLLLDDFLAEAARFKAPDVWLEVAVDNAQALALYERYGFARVRVRSRYYQPEGIDAAVMRLELGASSHGAADA